MQRGDREALDAVARDDAVDDHHEGAGRAADLHAAAAERRDEEARRRSRCRGPARAHAEAIANAIASGSATTPTITPASTSRASCARETPSRSTVQSFGSRRPGRSGSALDMPSDAPRGRQRAGLSNTCLRQKGRRAIVRERALHDPAPHRSRLAGRGVRECRGDRRDGARGRARRLRRGLRHGSPGARGSLAAQRRPSGARSLRGALLRGRRDHAAPRADARAGGRRIAIPSSPRRRSPRSTCSRAGA